MSPLTCSSSSGSLVASATVQSVISAARIRPVSSTARWSFLLAHHSEARRVDDEVNGTFSWSLTHPRLESTGPAGERGVVGRVEVDAHQRKDRGEQSLSLSPRRVEEEPEDKRRLDDQICVALPASALPRALGSQEARASGENQMVRSPRRARARSYSAKFRTLYLVL